MQRLLLITITILVGPMSWSSAEARAGRVERQIAYVGVHPIPDDAGGGFCNIEGPHVHVYRPAHVEELYRVVGGKYLFVGDPVAFGFDGPRHGFYGHHPIPVDALVDDGRHHDDDAFCLIDGPHFHIYQPPSTMRFEQRGDVYWYTGEWPRGYHNSASLHTKVNLVYEPLLYMRPIVTVSAPIAYQPPIFHVDVRPAIAVMQRPRPVVEVYVPWFIVDDYDDDLHYHRRHYHHHHEDDDD